MNSHNFAMIVCCLCTSMVYYGTSERKTFVLTPFGSCQRGAGADSKDSSSGMQRAGFEFGEGHHGQRTKDSSGRQGDRGPSSAGAIPDFRPNSES